jgi:multidrug efflux pump
MPGRGGQPKEVLESVTSFIGGGGPRFWFSVSPEQQQRNYAQVLVNVKDKHDTNPLIARLQEVLSREIPGAIVDARLLENGAAVGMPVAVRISGEDIPTLRVLAAPLQEALRKVPGAERVRENWGADTVTVALEVIRIGPASPESPTSTSPAPRPPRSAGTGWASCVRAISASRSSPG